MQFLFGANYQVDTGVRGGGFGRGVCEATERHVVCTGVYGARRIVEAVIAGSADDLARSQEFSCFADCAVFPSQVHAVRINRLGQRYVVVDNQYSLVVVYKRPQFAGNGMAMGVIACLVPVLNNLYAGGQDFGDVIDEMIAFKAAAVCNDVQSFQFAHRKPFTLTSESGRVSFVPYRVGARLAGSSTCIPVHDDWRRPRRPGRVPCKR